ncbi:MAG: hypothetical protein ACLR92_06225, partial [Bacilli bacterium]
TSTNTAGAKSATVTVPATTSASLTGTYYLWIKAGTLSDVSGNTSNQVVSALFKFDNTNPTVSVSTSKTTKSITAVATASATSGISKYEFSKDNGATWVANGTSNTYTFTGLTHKTAYNIKSRVTSGVGRQTSSATVATTTNTIPTPTYSASYASGKTTVTITYPSGCGSSYTCSYIKDGGTAVNVTSTTAAVAFTASGNVVAKVSDGTNTITASTYSTVVKYAITTSKNSTVNLTVTPNTTLTTSGTSVTFTVPSSSSYTYQGAYVYNSSGTKVMTLNASTRSFTMPAYAVRIAPIFKYNDKYVLNGSSRDTTFSMNLWDSNATKPYFEDTGYFYAIYYPDTTDYRGQAVSSKAYNINQYCAANLYYSGSLWKGTGRTLFFGLIRNKSTWLYSVASPDYYTEQYIKTNDTEQSLSLSLNPSQSGNNNYYVAFQVLNIGSSSSINAIKIYFTGCTYYS